MRFISRKFHAVLDYLSAVILLAAPWLFHFEDVAPARDIAVISGLLILLLAISTRYEGGVFKYFSMWTHLAVDITLGAFLASSPWMFGFSNIIFWPHLVMGLLAIGAGYFIEGLPQRKNSV